MTQKKLIVVTDMNVLDLHINLMFAPNGCTVKCCASYYGTKKAIEDGIDIIYTNQITFLNFDYCKLGYTLYLMKDEQPPIRIYEGMTVHNCKELRVAHNLYKIFMTGGFEKYFIKQKFERGI